MKNQPIFVSCVTHQANRDRKYPVFKKKRTNHGGNNPTYNEEGGED